jgi:hypothetical protein
MDQQQMFAQFMKNMIASSFTPEQMAEIMKDAMPADGRRETGYLYDGGPFSLINQDIYSLYVTGGTELTKWIPTRLVNYKVDEVQHIAYSVPKGFDGSQSYADYLSTITIPECGYGPAGFDWQGFAYRMEGGTFSFTTEMMKVWHDSGLKYYERQPLYQIRGGMGPLNGVIQSDKDWAIAHLLKRAEDHVDWINVYGERANSDMEWDGLSTIVQPGYIASKVVGQGAPVWADPVWMNGATLATPGDVLKTLDALVGKILGRIQARNWNVGNDDIAIYMNDLHFRYITEAMAAGGLNYYTSVYGFTGEMSVGDYEARLARMQSEKRLPLGGRMIRVLTDVNLGYSTTVNTSGTDSAAHTSDIFVLVRRLNGQNVLENLFIDWNAMDYPDFPSETMTAIQGGIARTGYITEANKCYYYYLEMGGRMVCRMMPLQGRLSNVTMTKHNLLETSEATAFWAPDFYAFNGVRGHAGTPLLFPYNG